MANWPYHAQKTEPNYSSSHITHKIPFLFCDVPWVSNLGGRFPICDHALSCQLFSALWLVMKSSCFYLCQRLKWGFSEKDWKLNKSICINVKWLSGSLVVCSFSSPSVVDFISDFDFQSHRPLTNAAASGTTLLWRGPQIQSGNIWSYQDHSYYNFTNQQILTNSTLF